MSNTIGHYNSHPGYIDEEGYPRPSEFVPSNSIVINGGLDIAPPPGDTTSGTEYVPHAEYEALRSKIVHILSSYVSDRFLGDMRNSIYDCMYTALEVKPDTELLAMLDELK